MAEVVELVTPKNICRFIYVPPSWAAGYINTAVVISTLTIAYHTLLLEFTKKTSSCILHGLFFFSKTCTQSLDVCSFSPKENEEDNDEFEVMELGISYCISKTEQKQNHLFVLERRGQSVYVADSVELGIQEERSSR